MSGRCAGWGRRAWAEQAQAPEPKLLACDIDGTLLDPNGILRPAVRLAIDRLRGAGVSVVLATARSPWATADVCRWLGLEGPQITMNGGVFGSPVGGEPVWARRMSLELVRDAVAFARSLDVAPLFCFIDRHAVQAPAGKAPAGKAPAGKAPAGKAPAGKAPAGDELLMVPDFAVGPYLRTVRSLDAIARHGPIRVYIPTGPARHHRALLAARDWMGARASVVWSDTEGLEILSPRTNKGEALRVVAESMGLCSRDVAAVGDGPNDLEMLRYAGRSAALLPAPLAVRAAARSVVPSSADDGALQALRGFFPVTLRSRPRARTRSLPGTKTRPEGQAGCGDEQG